MTGCVHSDARLMVKTIHAHARTRTPTNARTKEQSRISPKGFYLFPMHKFRLAASGSKGTFRDNTDFPGEFLLLSCATGATLAKIKEDFSYYADHKRPLCFCRCCLVGLDTRCPKAHVITGHAKPHGLSCVGPSRLDLLN